MNSFRDAQSTEPGSTCRRSRQLYSVYGARKQPESRVIGIVRVLHTFHNSLVWPRVLYYPQVDFATCQTHIMPVAHVAYQVILEPGIGQFREFESPRVHTRVNSWRLFLAQKLTCGKRESVS